MLSLEQLQAGLVIPVDKPRQWTSFQAVNKVKSFLRKYVERCMMDETSNIKHQTSNIKIKIGHAGTLDPLASGLLLVCVGKATKSIPQLQGGDKVYTGTMVLGATTPCYDLERPVDTYYPYEHITRELIEEAVRQFTGTILQIPPMFSAVKIGGHRAYDIARAENKEQKMENETPRAKQVTVYSFEITDFRQGVVTEKRKTENDNAAPTSSQLPTSHLYQNPQGSVPPHLPQVDFRISCGKGTYIRSLARDLGQALGSGAFLSALRRERVGDYSVADALPPDHIEKFFL